MHVLGHFLRRMAAPNRVPARLGRAWNVMDHERCAASQILQRASFGYGSNACASAGIDQRHLQPVSHSDCKRAVLLSLCVIRRVGGGL